MLRTIRSLAPKSAKLEGAMTDREEVLREVGISLAAPKIAQQMAYGLEPNGFSGYGEFTPITIRPYTTADDADLERDKPRD